MSAIAGIFNQDGRQVAEEQLRTMTGALARLGPKSESFWRAGNAGLAHRLSWFTKEDEFENQPFTGGDGRFTLVASARIDNRPELCESLRIAPADARAMPDSAFIMAALEKWGEECLSRLAGSFTLAAYDHRSGDLLLARDASGEQSLFYWTDGRRVAFASAPKALFALGFVPRKVNLERVADHLVVMPRDPNPHSWYEGIASLDAGCGLVVRRDSMRAFQFRRLDPCRETRYARDSDYVEAFGELWQRVVVDHARSRAETGILMSGGLDSTAVAAVAAPSLSRMGRRLAAFTEVPPADFRGAARPGWYADETPYVRAMANRFANIDLNFIRTEPGFILDGVEEYFAAAEAPLRSGVNRRWIEAICSSASIQGVPVLLTGQGGNLTISWAGRDLMTQLLTRGHWRRAWREAQALTRTGGARSVPAALAAGIVPFLPGPLWSILFRIRYPGRPSYAPGAPWNLRALIAPEFAREQRIAERARQLGHDLRFRRRRGIRTLVLGRETGEGDGGRGIESMFGVQLRSPATDPRIVEFCLSLPEDQFLRNGTPRWLIRRAMQGKLPDEILRNPLRGQQSAAWLEQFCLAGNRMDEELRQLDRSPLARLVIDLPRLRNLLSRLRGATDRNSAEAGWLRDMIGTALMTGRFLRWTEGAA